MKQQILRSICLVYLLGIAAVRSQYYTGVVPGNSPSLSLNLTLSNQTKSVAILFKVKDKPFSNLILLADTDPIPQLNITPFTLSNYYSQNHSILQQMDIQRVIAGVQQLINIKNPQGNTNLYIMLYNLDLPKVQTNKSYSLELKQILNDHILCYECPNSARLNESSSTCQCSPCPQNTYGAACEFYQRTFVPNTPYNASFYKIGNLYFRVVNPPPTITLIFTQLTDTNSSTLYIQYQAVIGAIAGSLNTYYDGNNKSFAYPITNTTNKLVIQTKNQNLSLTIACRVQLNTLINLGYQVPIQTSSSSKLTLGLAIGVPIGAITIIFLVVCLVCKLRNNDAPQNAPVNQFLLTLQEIERYLPQVPSLLVLSKMNLEQSRQNINKEAGNEQNAENNNQCCICLVQITLQEQIRVGYCKHFFHSKCLVGWFSKNQSCPYCRMDFSFAQTFAAYQKLKGNGPDLLGQQLVQAIFSGPREPQNNQKQGNKEQIEIQNQSNQIDIQRSQQPQIERQPAVERTQVIQRRQALQQDQRVKQRFQTKNIPNLEAITPSLEQFETG